MVPARAVEEVGEVVGEEETARRLWNARSILLVSAVLSGGRGGGVINGTHSLPIPLNTAAHILHGN